MRVVYVSLDRTKRPHAPSGSAQLDLTHSTCGYERLLLHDVDVFISFIHACVHTYTGDRQLIDLITIVAAVGRVIHAQIEHNFRCNHAGCTSSFNYLLWGGRKPFVNNRPGNMRGLNYTSVNALTSFTTTTPPSPQTTQYTYDLCADPTRVRSHRVCVCNNYARIHRAS